MRRDLDGCAESSSGPHKPQVIQRRPSPHRHAAVQAGRGAAVTRAQPLMPRGRPRRPLGAALSRARTPAEHAHGSGTWTAAVQVGGDPAPRRLGDGRAAESVPICAAAWAGLLLQR